jgi:hypothetical protein
MPTTAQSTSSIELYRPARLDLDVLIGELEATGMASHTAIETTLRERGADVLRKVYQCWLDARFVEERAKLALAPRVAGVEVRARRRSLEAEFGRVTVRRHGHKKPGKRAKFPMDEALNLPRELYSLSLRRRVVEEARAGSWDQSVERVDKTTAGHVPKRQAEGLAIHAATDFETFYAERSVPSNDTLSSQALLVMSSDSKGITMLPEALREATRKEAEAAKADHVRGDPMAQRKLRKHDKRMAIVTATWLQEPHERSAKDIVAGLRPQCAKLASKKKAKPTRGPRPQHKRVSASVEKSQAQGLAEMFAEAERRDPEHARTTVALVDGEERQLEFIKQQAKERKRSVTIVVDIIHVLHYVWLAGFALCRKDERKADAWVRRILFRLLTCHPLDVVAGIRQAATLRGLTPEECAPVDKCCEYLRKNSLHIDYRHFLARGFPIATGLIEGACRHLIQDRLGITGARWGVAGAEAILKLRALRSSGDWDAYWNFHENRERLRNHGPQPVAA